MSDLEVFCYRCKQIVRHVCDPDFQRDLKKLREFKLEAGLDPRVVEVLKESPYYQEGDEEGAFFGVILYCLLWKEDARTISALISNLARSAGVEDGLEWVRAEVEEAVSNCPT